MKNKTIALLCWIAVIVTLSGCSMNYSERQNIPDYALPEGRQYNTDAEIEFVQTENALVNQNILTLLAGNGYKNIHSAESYQGGEIKDSKVLSILDVKSEIYQEKDQKYLETRIICMIRKPGIVLRGTLSYPEDCRYFQAYSQLLIGTRNLTDMDTAAGYEKACSNLFLIDEFRCALEPAVQNPDFEIPSESVKQQIVNWKRFLSEDGKWNKELVCMAHIAAWNGDREAGDFLADKGLLYENIFVDKKQFFALVSKIAEQGNMHALNRLGLLYDNGEGIPENPEKAYEYYRKAADKGLAAAEFNVAYCLESGRGVPQDLASAVTWYRSAAAKGNSSAAKRLKELTQ